MEIRAAALATVAVTSSTARALTLDDILNDKKNIENTGYYYFNFLHFVNCGDYISKFYIDYPE